MEGPLMSRVMPLPSEAETTNTPINLLETVSLLNKHLTEALCREVFQSVRTTERQREWSLFALGRFWTAVAIQAPNSLGQALDQARTGGNGLLPDLTVTDGGSFQRYKKLHFKFFHALYYAFTQRLLGEAQPVYVTIKIFDVSGQQVHEAGLDRPPTVINDGTGPKYAYEYACDGHIPSGVYFYTVEAKKSGQGSIRKAGKLAVVR